MVVDRLVPVAANAGKEDAPQRVKPQQPPRTIKRNEQATTDESADNNEDSSVEDRQSEAERSNDAGEGSDKGVPSKAGKRQVTVIESVDEQENGDGSNSEYQPTKRVRIQNNDRCYDHGSAT